MKAFADNKKIVTQELKFVMERVQNIVGKPAFSPFSTMFFYPMKDRNQYLSYICIVICN